MHAENSGRAVTFTANFGRHSFNVPWWLPALLLPLTGWFGQVVTDRAPGAYLSLCTTCVDGL